MSESKEKLILDTIPLVYKLAKPYKHRYNYEDIVGEGMLGLVTAASKFEEIRGNCFSTYAYMQILGKILLFVATDKIVKPKRHEGKYISVTSVELNTSEENWIFRSLITDDYKEVQLFEDLNKVLNQRQYSIAYLLYQGYTKQDIINSLEISSTEFVKELKNIKIALKVYKEN